MSITMAKAPPVSIVDALALQELLAILGAMEADPTAQRSSPACPNAPEHPRRQEPAMERHIDVPQPLRPPCW